MEVARVKVKVAVARLMVAVVVARARVAAARKRELLSRCEAMQRPRRCGGRCLRPRCGARAGRRCWRSLGGAGRLLRLHQVEQAQVEQRLIFRRLAVAQLRQRRLRVHCRVSWLHAALLRATQGETYKTLAKKANSRKHALASAPVPCLPPVLKLARATSWRRKGMRGSGSGCCPVASAPASSFASSCRDSRPSCCTGSRCSWLSCARARQPVRASKAPLYRQRALRRPFPVCAGSQRTASALVPHFRRTSLVPQALPRRR